MPELVLQYSLVNILNFLPYTVVDCGALYDPTNGQVSTQHGTAYNRVATYTCVKGYELVGTASRTCTASGLWSSSAPTCNGKFPIHQAL